MNREVTLPLIVDDRGTLQVSAADVSKLLRTMGGRWLHLVEAGQDGLDEDEAYRYGRLLQGCEAKFWHALWELDGRPG